MRHLRSITAIVLALFLAVAEIAEAREPFTLDAVQAQVQRDYGRVVHLTGDAFAEKLKGGNVLLIDVREEPEYAVSHIAGAVRADPGIWRSTFLDRFGEKARGKTVVFYCSVGVRSSQLAARVQAVLKEQGAQAVYNLDGGVFGWHNANRPLVNAKGKTEFVHPFDDHWGKLLMRQELAKTRP